MVIVNRKQHRRGQSTAVRTHAEAGSASGCWRGRTAMPNPKRGRGRAPDAPLRPRRPRAVSPSGLEAAGDDAGGRRHGARRGDRPRGRARTAVSGRRTRTADLVGLRRTGSAQRCRPRPHESREQAGAAPVVETLGEKSADHCPPALALPPRTAGSRTKHASVAPTRRPDSLSTRLHPKRRARCCRRGPTPGTAWGPSWERPARGVQPSVSMACRATAAASAPRGTRPRPLPRRGCPPYRPA